MGFFSTSPKKQQPTMIKIAAVVCLAALASAEADADAYYNTYGYGASHTESQGAAGRQGRDWCQGQQHPRGPVSLGLQERAGRDHEEHPLPQSQEHLLLT